jgi:hypothetical protein
MSETGHVSSHPHSYSERDPTGKERNPVWAQMMDCLATYVQDHKKLMELLAR